jgi:hypothetical protein
MGPIRYCNGDILMTNLLNYIKSQTIIMSHHNITIRPWLYITPKCVLIHFGFHFILNEFGHFYHGETN